MIEDHRSGYRCLGRRVLADANLTLRSVQPGDIEQIRRWRNAQMHVLRQSAPIDSEEQVGYFEREIWPSFDAREPPNILLSYLEGRSLIGYGGLVHIAWEHRRAEVSFLLAPELSVDESVYATYFMTYLRLLEKLAFHDLGLHRLWTETFALRSAHIACLEQAGFRLEGRLVDHVFIDGEPTDALIHGCVSDG